MTERGTYCDLTMLKRALGIADSRDDVRLLELAEYASRRIDLETGRRFYAATATRYYTARRGDELLTDDLLSVSALATDDGSRTYPDIWQATDYDLEPSDEWPRWLLAVAPLGSYSFPTCARGVRVAGVWGYGDGESATPWRVSGLTATVATTGGATVTTSGGTGLAIGQTWLVEDEQVYVLAGAGTSWTVERGVNGTTGAAHAGVALGIARYPAPIVEACRMRVEMEWSIPLTGSAGSADVGTTAPNNQTYARYRDIVESYRLVGVG